jgi:hypothetical protein
MNASVMEHKLRVGNILYWTRSLAACIMDYSAMWKSYSLYVSRGGIQTKLDGTGESQTVISVIVALSSENHKTVPLVFAQ